MTPILIVDGSNFLCRAYFAVGEARQGEFSSVARAFFSILLSDLNFLEARHCAVVFDAPGGSFRDDIYPEYKNREESEHSRMIKKYVSKMAYVLRIAGIRVYRIKGIEGDDLIGSAATSAVKLKNTKAFIASTDKDFAALVTDRIHLLRPQKLILDADGVFEHYGVKPEQVVEYLMLLGDKIDNIPGVPGIGHKKAVKALAEFGTLKAWASSDLTPAARKKLDATKTWLKTSRKLITIQTHHLPNLTKDSVALVEPDAEFKDFCAKHRFEGVARELATLRKER